MELAERLTTKVGPLPAWAWAAIPAGAYIIYSYLNRGDDGGVVEAPVDEEFINEGSYPSLPGYPDAPYGSPNYPDDREPDRYNNQDWSQQAIAYLISTGVRSEVANRAIGAYLYGLPPTLNNEEYNALQRALLQLGPAPDGGRIPPRTGKPPPDDKPPKGTPKVPAVRNLTMTANAKTNLVVLRWGRLTGNFRYEYNIASENEGWGKEKIVRGTRVTETRKGPKGTRLNARVRAVDSKGNKGPWATTRAVLR